MRVVREKSFTLLQARRAAATMLQDGGIKDQVLTGRRGTWRDPTEPYIGSGTRSMAQRSAIPFLTSQPSMSALLKIYIFFYRVDLEFLLMILQSVGPVKVLNIASIKLLVLL